MSNKKEKKTATTLKHKLMLRKLAEEDVAEQQKEVMYKYGVGKEELAKADHK